jgi:hypothetical protein
MNFFNWIREGVRQAVLLGVSEAVETIGVSPDGENMSHRMLEVIRSGGPQISAAGAGAAAPALTVQSRRKKLGRSLNDIQSDRK